MFLIPNSYYLIKKTKNKGRGVFAKKDIKPGVIIGDYLGIILNDKKLEEYEKKYGFYGMSYTTNSTIFPTLSKPGIHLINNSCTPNCECTEYHGHMIYFTLRKIFAGEELTVNYTFPLDSDIKEHHLCFCGSQFCRGNMYCTQEKFEKINLFYKKIDKKYWNKMEVNFEENLQPFKKYPETIPDYEIFDLYSNSKQKPVILKDSKLPKIKALRKKIRETGRSLTFSKIGLTIYGISGKMIISTLK